MGRIVFFWMTQQPDPDHMDGEAWMHFLDDLALFALLMFGLFLIISLVFYRRAAIAKKIRTPPDVFSAYTPWYRLLIALLAGVAVLIFAAVTYHSRFSESTVSWAGSSANAGAAIALETLLVAYFLTWTAITPPKFRYRTRGFLYGGRK